jgi:hypothetical protein
MKHLLLILAMAFTGCATFKPGRGSLTTVAAVLEAERGIMTAWANYVVEEEQRIAALPVIDQGSQAADLLRAEGRVQKAHGAFLKARAAAERAMTALAQRPDKTAPPSELLASFSNLVTATAQ